MPIPGRQISVLLVDPDPYVSRVIDAGLSKEGALRVTATMRAREALTAAFARSYDVILWELRLKETFEILPQVQALCADAALILMTTDDRYHVPAELSHLSIAGILVKPFGLDALTGLIARALTDTPLAGARKCLDVACAGQQIVLISEAGRSITRVFDVALDTFTVIGSPRVSTPPDFEVGTPVKVEVQGEDALYSFRSQLSRLITFPIPCWELRMPAIIHRRQRRKYPRQTLQLPVLLRYRRESSEQDYGRMEVSSEESAGHADSEISGMTENLSLGGCAIISPQPVPTGTHVLVEIEGMENMGLQEEGQVCRCSPYHSGTGFQQLDVYHLAVRFSAPDRQSRQRLRQLLGN